MNSVEFIIKNLKDLHTKFVQSNIRYEHLPNIESHLIEITPKEFYQCDEYINEELRFEEKFNEIYFDEDIIFISSDSLNKISNPIFEVYEEKSGIFRTDFEVINVSSTSFQETTFYFESTVNFFNDNEFALAA